MLHWRLRWLSLHPLLLKLVSAYVFQTVLPAQSKRVVIDKLKVQPPLNWRELRVTILRFVEGYFFGPKERRCICNTRSKEGPIQEVPQALSQQTNEMGPTRLLSTNKKSMLNQHALLLEDCCCTATRPLDDNNFAEQSQQKLKGLLWHGHKTAEPPQSS